MKKYLMSGLAAIVLCVAFTSCSKNNDVFDPNAAPSKQQTPEEKIISSYEKAYEDAFGPIGSGQDWGLSKYGTVRASTRANAIITGDPFTFENTSGYYIETIDETQYTNLSTISNLDQSSDTEWVVTADFPKINFYAGHHTFYIKGNVSIPDNAYMYDATFYILKGSTLTMNKTANYNTVIYVADGGTLNYNVDKLERNPQGGALKNAIYNHGTVNLPDNFKVSNGSIFYNEGSVSGKNISSAPADGDPSFFYNYGTVELSGNHQLNSDASFYNEGTFMVAGDTELTQGNNQIWWVNKGYYQTLNFKSKAWNGECYNFCQLAVTGEAQIQNGVFNLMDNSYAEIYRGVFNNLKFLMRNNSGINFTDGTLWGRDGADFRGKYEIQGFEAIDDNAAAYVRMGGTNKIAAHKGCAFHLKGANLTLAYDIINFYHELYYFGETWDQNNTQFANITTEEALIEEKNENRTWDIHNVTKIFTGEDFAKVTVNPKSNDCGATWTVPGEPEENEITYQGRIMGEDLTAEADNDFDFNDVVFDWAISADKKTAYIKLYAAGGTLPLKIGTAVGQGEEVHDLFKVSRSTMVNTGVGADGITKDPVEFTLTGTFNSAADIIVSVDKTSKGASGYMQMTAKIGEAPCLLYVPLGTKWIDEYINIEKGYTWFGGWSRGENAEQWSTAPVEKYSNLKLSDNN